MAGSGSHADDDHESHVDHDHESHADHDHESHADHDHESHADHDQESHADHDQQSHADHDQQSHADHDHESHAEHDHESHAGHDHEPHAGHDRESHAGHHDDPHAGHDYAHDLRGASRRRRLALALVLISTYMVAEIIGGIMSGSLALLADAGHMLTDAVAIVMALMAMWIARREASVERTSGITAPRYWLRWSTPSPCGLLPAGFSSRPTIGPSRKTLT